MNYRHAFHAGNFADVHKHIVLLALIERLTRKPKPLFYLDTHAGRGWYDLRSHEAQRGDEHAQGIGRMPQQAVADDLRRYLRAVHALRDAINAARGYPGSPLLALHQLRGGDRAVFLEQQIQEAHALESMVARRRGVAVECGDGYAALKTYLPPRENRGLVLIDPPYESDREFAHVAAALQTGLARWPSGAFAVWYPIKADAEAARFHAALRQGGLRKLLLLELSVRPPDSPLGLNGSGMLIANPPWKFDAEIEHALDEAHQLLDPQRAGRVRIEWLVGE